MKVNESSATTDESRAGLQLSSFTMGKVNFNTKHLKKGDPMPPYNGKLRVYSMRYCPWAQRAILALIAKQVDFEVVNIDITDKPDWFIAKSPLGKVPSLEIADGVCIYESLVVSEYIDETYLQRPLRSKDPVQKAFDRIIAEAYGVQPTYYKALRTPETITKEDTTTFYRAVDFVQEQLRQRGTTFLGGKEPGFVDYMIWPWFERIVMLDGIGGSVSIDKQKYKLLTQYFEEMFKDPAVSQYLVPKECAVKFTDYYKKIPVNLDMLLEK